MILLFANGDIPDISWLPPYFDKATAVIGVDGGTHHIINAGHKPDILIGDLDSIDPILVNQLESEGVELHRYPRAKNETDLELALILTIERPEWQQQDILVFGVVGGRLDQTLANIHLLAHPALTKRTVKLIAQYQTAWLIHEHSQLTGQIGDTISLIPLGGTAHIGHTENLRWNLHDEPLHFGPARGVSNELTAEIASITLDRGQLLCIHTQREWQR